MRAILALILIASAQAHEIGTTRVSALFEEGKRYRIEIVTDAVSLADKLAVMSGEPSVTSADAGMLLSHSQVFQRRVKVAFDGIEVQPKVDVAVANGVDKSTSIATVTLSGEIPSGAKQFSWNYGWTFATYALTVRNSADEKADPQWLEGGQQSHEYALSLPGAARSRLSLIWQYLTLGFTHIMPGGFDHVLFVLGLYLFSGRPKTVLLQVSAFTVAHSITLGLSMYGLIHVPSSVVEPLIAISIAYIAVENIFLTELRSWRVALVFCFGLLHGMGFAGALAELGLPRSEFLTALLSFNVGVEAGQLTIITAAFLLVGWHWSNRAWYRSRVVVPASLMIACMAAYWTVERLAA